MSLISMTLVLQVIYFKSKSNLYPLPSEENVQTELKSIIPTVLMKTVPHRRIEAKEATQARKSTAARLPVQRLPKKEF